MIRTLILPSGFRRDSAVLVGGAVAAQLLGIIAMPILTRVYERAEFGVLGAFAAVVAILSQIACLRYEQAVMIAEESRVPDVLQLSLWVTTAMSAALALTVAFFGPSLLAAIGVNWAPAVLWLLPAALLAFGVFQTEQVWLSRCRRFASQSGARIARTVVELSVQLGIGLFVGASAFGLMIGHVLGVIAQSVTLFLLTWKSVIGGEWRIAPRSNLKREATRYGAFPKYSMPAGVAAVLGQHGFTVVIALLVGPETAGLFYLAHRVMALPTSLISQSLGPAFYQRMSTLRKSPRQGEAFVATVFITLLALVIGPIALVVVFGPWLFEFCFGPDWSGAGQMIRYMWPGYLMMFCAMPITQAFYVFEKQAIGFYWQLTFVVLRIASVAIAYRVGGAEIALAAYGAVGALMYSIVIVLAIRWTGCRLADVPSVLSSASADLLARMVRKEATLS